VSATALDEPTETERAAYFPALDGVRGIAVLVIMGYHGGVFLTNGGFYSLDTFFALSGFLITSLLVAEWRTTGTLRLRTFWSRRARRLLPALLVLLLGVAVYNALLVPVSYTHLDVYKRQQARRLRESVQQHQRRTGAALFDMEWHAR